MAFSPGNKIRIKKKSAQRGDLSSTETLESVEQLQETDEDLVKQVTTFQTEVEKKIEIAEKDNKSTDKKIKKNETDIDGMRSDVFNLEQERELLKKQIREATSELEDTQVKMKAMKFQITQTTDALDLLEETVENLAEKIVKKVRKELNEAEKNIITLEEEFEKLHKRDEELTEMILTLASYTEKRFDEVRKRFLTTGIGMKTNHASIAVAWAQHNLGTPPRPLTPSANKIGTGNFLGE